LGVYASQSLLTNCECLCAGHFSLTSDLQTAENSGPGGNNHEEAPRYLGFRGPRGLRRFGQAGGGPDGDQQHDVHHDPGVDQHGDPGGDGHGGGPRGPDVDVDHDDDDPGQEVSSLRDSSRAE
jgi:hypothetical protein